MDIRRTPLLLAVSLVLLVPATTVAQGGGRAAAAGPPIGLPESASGEVPSWAGPDAPWGNPGAGNALGLGPVAARERARARMEAQRRAQRNPQRHAMNPALDIDPKGDPVLRGQVVGIVAAAQALASIQSAGFTIVRQQHLEGLGLDVTVFAIPADASLRDALGQLQSLDPKGTYDYDHVYFESGAAASGADSAPSSGRPDAIRTRQQALPKVGLIDGGVDAAHPALRDVRTIQFGCGGTVIPSEHGTAVASRLLDGLAGPATGRPAAELYAADVYCDRPTGGAADAISDAVAWMVRNRVPVINVSLVGPSNALLKRVIEAAVARGFLIVAAVGNDGPSAPPLYPAAYPGVIAVTGVDSTDKVLLEAGRGPFVAFAAPGADVSAASIPDGYSKVRGTSFAAPLVAGRLARLLDQPDPGDAARAIRSLADSALDLGAPGRDPVYGNGCIGCLAPVTAEPTAAAR